MFASFFLWEIRRAAQRPWFRNLRLAYTAVVAMLFLLHFISVHVAVTAARKHAELNVVNSYTKSIRDEYLKIVHCFSLFGLAPLLAVGPVAQEKKLKTLDLLLTTQLRSSEIILSKWLAACAELVIVLIPSLPFFLWAQGFLDEPWWTLALWYIGSLLFILPFTATSILAAVLLRQQTNAIIAAYLANLAILFVAMRVFTEAQLNTLPGAEYDLEFWLGFVLIIATATVSSLSFAIWRLRSANEACRHVTEKPRLPWSRPPVSDEPIYWKQRYVSDGAVIWMLRYVPRWLRIAAYGAVCTALALVLPPDIYWALWIAIGNLLVFPLTTLVVAGATVSAERDAGTWDALCLTFSATDYVKQTVRGVKAWISLYWLAQLPALLVLLYRFNEVGLLFVLFWIMTGIEIHYCAIGGVHASVRTKSGWTAILRGLTLFLLRLTAAAGLGFMGTCVLGILGAICLHVFPVGTMFVHTAIMIVIFAIIYQCVSWPVANGQFIEAIDDLVRNEGMERR